MTVLHLSVATLWASAQLPDVYKGVLGCREKLAHLGSQVQGTDGPGVGADLDVQSSRTGLIETHLPIPVACGYCPMPQLHGRARDPGRVITHFIFL